MTLCSAMPESEISVDVLSAVGDTVLARAELVAARREQAAVPTPHRLTVALVRMKLPDTSLSRRRSWSGSGSIGGLDVDIAVAR